MLKKVCTLLLIVLTVNFYFPEVSFSKDVIQLAKADITMHPIKTRSTPDKEKNTENQEKKSHWLLWGLLGAAVIGGGAALAGGGGSGGGGGDDEPSGSATISW